MKGSGLNSWSKKQLTRSDHSEHLFKPLVFKKKKKKRKGTISFMWKLLLAEMKPWFCQNKK